jgi:hypothetical protein
MSMKRHKNAAREGANFFFVLLVLFVVQPSAALSAKQFPPILAVDEVGELN